jgi:hypothetical protein
MQAAYLSKQPTNTRQHTCATTLRNTIIIFYTAHNSKLYLRFFAIICILYFYLTGAGIIPNLAAIAAAPLSAHSLPSLLVIKSNTLLTIKVFSTCIYCLL